MTDVTRILNAIEGGDAKATDELLPLVYEELRLLAAQKLAHEKPGQTLQATALVHEVYVRLVQAECRNWNSRNHFFMAAAEAMRRILVENARRKRSMKNGGDLRRVSGFDVESQPCVVEIDTDDLLALDEALEYLSAEDPALAGLIKLHCFAGLSLAQVAEVSGVSRRTVERHWAFARAWLHKKIRG